MRLHKRLLINGHMVALASDYVKLALNQVGAGIFELNERPASGSKALVELYVGVGDADEYLVFTGALTDSRELAAGRYRIDALELSTVLETTVILNMRHATPRQIVGKIEGATGLRFLLPARADYLDERRVGFQFYGRARDALERTAKLWGAEEAVWFQLPDGRMYWGHWALGPYTKAPLPIEPQLITSRDDERRVLEMPYIPILRPGMVVQADFRFLIDTVVLSGDTVRIAWRSV